MLRTGLKTPDSARPHISVRYCLQSALAVLLLLSPASFAGAGTVARSAEKRADGPCPGPDPGCADFTLPPWSDGAGWTDPGRYTTILTADLDGDGRVEILGRSSEGLEVWEMRDADGSCAGPGTGCGRWEHVSTNSDFSDHEGYDDPLLASTIHAARLYGTAAAQIYTWDSNGVLVYQYDKSTKQLTQTDTVHQFQAQYDNYREARYMETLQAVAWLPEDGQTAKGSLNLAMRDVNNNGQILVVGYCGPSAGWCKSAVLEGFDNDTRFGTEEFAWRTIRFGDIDNDGKPDVWGSDGIEIVWVKNDGASGAPQPDYVLPDGTDWGQPSHYLPMIQGFFYKGRGAGGVQILLRGSDTLHILFFLDGSLHEEFQTLVNDSGTLLTDPSLDPTEYSGTWQAMDVDGDGASEVIVRTPGGVRIFILNQSVFPQVLSEITQPGFANTDRWAGDSRARTIRIVKSGDGFLLVGRSAIGIQTGRLIVGTVKDPGHFEKISAPFPQFTGVQLTAYDSISTQLGLTMQGVRSVYSNSEANINTYLLSLLDVENPGIEAMAWQKVYDQVHQELTWAAFAAGLFDFNEKVIDESFISGGLTAAAVVKRLSIGEDRARAIDTQEVKFILTLTGDMAQLLSLFPSKGINFINSVFDTVVGLVKTNPDNLPNAIAAFDQRLASMFNEAVSSNGLSRAEVAADYGLLAEVGRLVQSGEWPLDEATRAHLLAASQYSLEYQLWKALTPSAWKIFACGEHSNNAWPNFDCDGTHAGAVSFGNGVRSWPIVDLSPTFDVTETNPALVQKMFNPTPTSCIVAWDLDTCGFALDPKAVYRGQTEFRIPCVSITGDDISGFSRTEYGAPCDQIGPSLPRVAPSSRLPRTVKPRPVFMGFMGKAGLTSPISRP